MSKIAGEINHHMMRNAKTRAINAPALDLIADILEQHTAGILAGVKEHMDKRKSEARSAGFDAADMATAAAQGFLDGATATAQPAAQHYGPLRDADAEYGQQLSVYSTPKSQPVAEQANADSVQEDAARLLALEAAANQIFNNPPSETSQDVRDVIEWFSGSIRVVLDAARKQGATT